MIDTEKQERERAAKAKVRRRMHGSVDPENYEYIAAKKQVDFYDTQVQQNVGIYVRVSTDNIRQTTSYELQQIYYEDYVKSRPNWTLYKIYADEGISGTSLKHRDAFNRMIADAKAGKIDLIITKSVSRFARNIMIAVGTVRELAQLRPPVGVFFESEAIFSLNDDSQMSLAFVATMAEEESHTRSRSMETSLRMRLDNGIPLTPKLLGYTHDADGNLVVNQQEAPTVRLAFYMYLYGYSTQQIADTLIALGRRSYLGNIKWTSNAVVQILRNERHCGDVLTRKTFTEDFRTHRTLKNRGERPQSHYRNHHEGIVSRDDFIAVQQLLNNAKYGNRSFLPELRVMDSGLFKGFVVINPRWAAFTPEDYRNACRSVYPELQDADAAVSDTTVRVEASPGDFDLREFEITRSEFFDPLHRASVTFQDKRIKLSAFCIQKFGEQSYVEFLVHPLLRKFAIRSVEKTNRRAVCISGLYGGKRVAKYISSTAFSDTLFALFGWNTEYKYKITGTFVEQNGERAVLFDTADSETFLKSFMLPPQDDDPEDGSAALQPLTPSGKHVRAIPQEWTNSFGKQFYVHEKSYAELARQSKSDWSQRMQGQLYETGNKLQVTEYEELRRYIQKEAGSVLPKEDHDGNCAISVRI